MSAKPVGASATAPPDPFAIVRTRGYTGLLVVAALLGVPISAVAFGFLALTHELQSLTYSDLPRALGFHSTPTWWPVPLLVVAGLLVELTIRYLPGIGGHKPAEGMKTTGAPTAVELPGIVIAALASLGIGAVLGPEAPLIALGGGLAVWTVRLVKREIRPNASAVVGAAGSFAAVSALLGSPLLGAFLLMGRRASAGPCSGWSLCRASSPQVWVHSSSSDWVRGPGWERTPWHSTTCRGPMSRTSPSSVGRSSSGWWRPSSAKGSGGSPCSCRRGSSDGRWWAPH